MSNEPVRTDSPARRLTGKSRERLRVKIFSPDQIYFQGQALSVSANNAAGPFDILIGHVNFLCLLVPGQIKVDTGYQMLQFPLSHGILNVATDMVTIFIGV